MPARVALVVGVVAHVLHGQIAAALHEVAQERVAIRNLDRIVEVDVRAVLAKRRRDDLGDARQPVRDPRVADADLREPIDVGDLRAQQPRLHRRHPAQVVLGNPLLDRRRVLAAPTLVERLDLTQISEPEDLVRRQREDHVGGHHVAGQAERGALEQELCVLVGQAREVVAQVRREIGALRRDETAVEAVDVLRHAEAEDAGVAERAEPLPVDARTERLRGVLDERDALRAADLRDAFDVTREAVQVRDHDGASVVVDQPRDLGRVDVARLAIDVREHRRRAGADHHVDDVVDRVRREDDLLLRRGEELEREVDADPRLWHPRRTRCLSREFGIGFHLTTLL